MTRLSYRTVVPLVYGDFTVIHSSMGSFKLCPPSFAKENFLFSNQFLSNSVDILLMTYKYYSANFRKVSFIVNELFR